MNSLDILGKEIEIEFMEESHLIELTFDSLDISLYQEYATEFTSTEFSDTLNIKPTDSVSIKKKLMELLHHIKTKIEDIFHKISQKVSEIIESFLRNTNIEIDKLEYESIEKAIRLDIDQIGGISTSKNEDKMDHLMDKYKKLRDDVISNPVKVIIRGNVVNKTEKLVNNHKKFLSLGKAKVVSEIDNLNTKIDLIDKPESNGKDMIKLLKMKMDALLIISSNLSKDVKQEIRSITNKNTRK